MKTDLLRGLRIVERADTNSMRRVMFARYAEGHASVRVTLFVYALIRRTFLGTLMVGAYGTGAFLSLGRPRQRPDILALGRFANARLQLQSVASCIGEERVSWAAFGGQSLFSAQSYRDLFGQITQRRAVRRYLRRVRRSCRQHDFYVSCRLASTLALYARSLQVLAAASPRAVLVSSDYNTEEVALTRAARRRHIPSIFIAHAHTNRLSPPLDLDLAILDGQAALDVYREKGPIRSAVVFRGVEGPSRPLALASLRAPSPVIGLFLPSQIRWETLRDVVHACRRRFGPRRFRIRWHPNMIESHQLAVVTDALTDIDISPKGTPLVDDARQCAFVIADESSNVHLTVLKTGIPTLAIQGLGIHPADMEDQYGFIRNGIIPPLIASVDALSIDDVTAFYGAGWDERFRYYDAGYMRAQDEVDRQVRDAVLSVTRPA